MTVTAGTLAPTVAEVGTPPPAPPRLVISDRRPDPTRLEHIIPPTLADELGDAAELAAHRDTYARWQANTKRAEDLQHRHAEALEHDREAEQDFAIGKTKRLPESTAPPIELELTGARRAVDVLERELVQSAARLFASALDSVPAAQAALERRLDEDDDRVAGLLEQARAVLAERALAAAEGGWLYRAQWETSLAPYLPRAGVGGRAAAELAELAKMLEHDRAEARRKRFDAKVEEEMLFVAPRVPRTPSSRPREELRAEAAERVQAREARAA
jgi:hypothetical protein